MQTAGGRLPKRFHVFSLLSSYDSPAADDGQGPNKMGAGKADRTKDLQDICRVRM